MWIRLSQHKQNAVATELTFIVFINKDSDLYLWLPILK